MFKYKKFFSIILTLIMSVSFFIGCGQQMTDEQYSQLENNFYKVYDPIVKDFYNEALQGINGQLISSKLYRNHKDDIDKLGKIYNVENSKIPSNKKEAYKKINDEFVNVLALSSNSLECEVPSNLSEKKKQDIVENCKKFISFNKDKIDKLSINQNSEASSDNIKSELELVDKTTKSENGITYIVGTVKNNTNKTYSYVSIKINLYDSSNNQVGNTLDSISNLEPNGTWKFKCSTSVNFDKYKIISIGGN